MFTGIITAIGTVARIERSGDARFTFAAPAPWLADAALGASIACSGVCLTVVKKTAESFIADISAETLRCTTLGDWREGERINLERALKVGGELGGHFVTGHVDGVGVIAAREIEGDSLVLGVDTPPELARFISEKGSVTLDGVSLTVNKVENARFWVNIVPHTQHETTFSSAKPGSRMNIEIDPLARMLARLMEK